MKYLDRIENYLNDNLSNEERISFDEDCQTNEELVEELSFYIQTQQTFKQNKEAAFKERYQTAKVNNTIPHIQSNQRSLYVRMVASAAVVALLIWFGMPNFSSYEVSNKLADGAAQISPFDRERTGNQTAEADLFLEAVDSIRAGSYKVAIDLVDTLDNNKAEAIKAFAYFELGNYPEAAKNYESYLGNNPSRHKRIRAQWNLSLVYRKLGNKEAERKILEQIGRKGRKDILNELSKISE